MGQEKSFAQTKQQSTKISIYYEQQILKFPKKMSPLCYIKPVQYSSQDPCALSELDLRSKTAIDCQNDDKQNNQQDELSIQQQNPNPLQEEKQLICKKVAVKWDKFIKMKRKNFTSDYRVIKQIGRGGFGCVYKVIMKNESIYRAAKKISKSCLKKEEHQNLLAQMAIMMHMDHPNITKLYQVYDQPKYYVMILQFCDGGELFDKIVQKSINQKQARRIIWQILSALHYMHSKGIVHRDIKPENMLFQKKTNLVKIIDFGISAKIQPNKLLNVRVGTPYYIAPEVLMKKYNQKCDLWSLGVVLYMMIYNIPPFKGNQPAKIMEAVVNGQINYRNPSDYNFSNVALDFLKRLLVRSPKQRMSAEQALNHKWFQCFSKHQTVANQNEKDKVLQRITKFHFKNKLQAVVYTYIVSQLLSGEQRVQLHGIFKSLDKNHNGIIQVNQLQLALQSKDYFALTDEKIKLIKDYLDTNCSGVIDYTQFLVGGLDFQKTLNQKHFSQAFTYFDIDNSGQITFEEVAKFLQDQIESQQELRQLFKQVDKNGDGVISKIQFIHLLAYKKIEQI